MGVSRRSLYSSGDQFSSLTTIMQQVKPEKFNNYEIAGGYACQDAFVTSATAAARAGAQVAQVPHHSFSLWNNYQVLPKLGAGLGILDRADMYAAIDNKVRLPGYPPERRRPRISLSPRECVFRRTWKTYSIGLLHQCGQQHQHLAPASPRALRVGLIARF